MSWGPAWERPLCLCSHACNRSMLLRRQGIMGLENLASESDSGLGKAAFLTFGYEFDPSGWNYKHMYIYDIHIHNWIYTIHTSLYHWQSAFRLPGNPSTWWNLRQAVRTLVVCHTRELAYQVGVPAPVFPVGPTVWEMARDGRKIIGWQENHVQTVDSWWFCWHKFYPDQLYQLLASWM